MMTPQNPAAARDRARSIARVRAWLACATCAAMLTGCSQHRATPTPTPTPTAAPTSRPAEEPPESDLTTEREFYPADSETPVVVRGRVERMGWTKSGESWNAGGSGYFVLERDGEVSPRDRLGKRVIMRPTPAYPRLGEFIPFTGQHVEIRGRRAGWISWKPDPMSQHPSSLNSDGTISRGGGILVESIQVLPDPSVPAPK